MMRLLSKMDSLLKPLVPTWLASLVLRVAVAVPFWKSGVTKWDGFGVLSDTPIFLFQSEFKLHILGQQYAFPFPTLMAYASSIGEILLPILVVLGLFTRMSAFGLLIMTAIIQLTFPGAWALHLTWAAMAIGVIALGGDRLSLDRFLNRS